jgi:deoxyribose-phosphate aldolase
MEIKVNDYLEDLKKSQPATLSLLREINSVIDLTTLSPSDDDESVSNLCHKASNQLGEVAAVCVYPKFVPIAADLLSTTKIRIASVANFPSGSEKLSDVFKEIDSAILAGANEIDTVFPYTFYLEGNKKKAMEYIAECKIACGKATLKVILEISEFPNLPEIYTLSQELIALGVNFIKTSTGKSKHGATLEASSAMLLAIRETPCNTGFKTSGGVRSFDQACAYLDLAKNIMGEDWVTPLHFRIGASTLLDDLLSLANQFN